MKTSDMALLAALGIGGYYLFSKGKDNQQQGMSGGGGGSPISLDLSGLLGGIGGLGSGGGVAMPDFSGFLSGLNGLFAKQGRDITGLFNQGQAGITDLFNQGGKSVIDLFNAQAQGLIDIGKAEAAKLAAAAAAAGGNTGVIPAAVDLLGGLGGVHLGGKNADWQGIKERSAGDFLGVGLAWLSKLTVPMAIRALGPGVAASVGGKLAVAGTGIGVPLAIAWTGADILTTVYELATGKDVPIVGFGELFHPTQKEAVVSQVAGVHQIAGVPPGYDRKGNPPGWDTSVMNPAFRERNLMDAHKAQIPEKAIAIKEAVLSPGQESPVPYSRFNANYTQTDYNSDIALLNKNLTADQKRAMGL